MAGEREGPQIFLYADSQPDSFGFLVFVAVVACREKRALVLMCACPTTSYYIKCLVYI